MLRPALTGALVGILVAAVPSVPAAAGDRPRCGEPGGSEFPIGSRLTGGPDSYERGATAQTWRLELRNGTQAGCRAVHPVVVLADQGRALQPGQIHLDFYDPGAARWRPVHFERTDEAENVGVLDGRSPDFPGFTVPAYRTVVVPLRLGFTDRAPEGAVTASVTAVQRRGGDGAWVGESDDYTFTVGHHTDPPQPGLTPRPGDSPPGGEGDEQQPVLADTGNSRAVFGVGVAGCVLVASGAVLALVARRLRR